MNSSKDDLKNKVWAHFKNMQNVFLATGDADQPKVRPVTMLYYNDRFWVGTGTEDAKIRQIEQNRKIEFCLLIKGENTTGYIRGTGRAVIIEDAATRKLLADAMPYFKDFWKDPADPRFTLLEVIIEQLEYMEPGKIAVERFSI
ncbi:MAG: pyridoxamine 5'-phosphate oxidase family protein [candidate division WOR-3 bacterium]|nr:MAG: pyridoxamine 5'-phosphate oxidase family protein [candidate division WOR-3 bacterium]